MASSKLFKLSAAVTVCLCFPLLAFAASDSDRFEVAKTKIQYLLTSGQFSEALAFSSENSEFFQETTFDDDWTYWRAVSYSRSGQLDKAHSEFSLLNESNYSNSAFPLEFGNVLIKLERFEQARTVLSEFLVDQPDHLVGRYYLALALFETNPSQAAKLLAALDEDFSNLDVDKQGISHDQVIYMLAASLNASKQYGQSRKQLDRLINQQEETAYRDSAEFLLISVEKAELANRPWRANIAVSGAYDSNVELLADVEQGDVRGAVTLDSEYRLNDALAFSYVGFASFHGQTTSYNLFSNTLGVTFHNSDSRMPMPLNYSISFNSLEGALWQISHLASVNLTPVVAGLKLSARYDQDILNQDASKVGVAIDTSWQLSAGGIKPRVSTELGLDLDREFAVNAMNGFVQSSATLPLYGWQFKPSVKLGVTQYVNNELKQQTILTSASAQMSRRWSTNLQTSFKLDAFLSSAKPDLFSYQRTVFTTNATWSF